MMERHEYLRLSVWKPQQLGFINMSSYVCNSSQLNIYAEEDTWSI